MNIHILRSEEVSPDLYWEVVDLVRAEPGSVNYLAPEYDNEDGKMNDSDETESSRENHASGDQSTGLTPVKLRIMKWETLFGYCNQFREKNNIPDRDVVVWLTDHRNSRNFFSSWDSPSKPNFFIQTSFWNQFVESEPKYPIVHELASIPLMLSAFDSSESSEQWAHKKPRGCVFDMCQDKKDIMLKLRTADICPDCRELLIRRKIEPAMARQVLAIYEAIRKHMLFRKNLDLIKQPSRMIVDLNERTLSFPDISKKAVSIGPVEMTLYEFFLRHPEGMRLTSLIDNKDEINHIYWRHSKVLNIAEISQTIERLVRVNSNSRNESMGRMKKSIISAVGEEIADLYLISGKRGKKFRIGLDPSLIKIIGL